MSETPVKVKELLSVDLHQSSVWKWIALPRLDNNKTVASEMKERPCTCWLEFETSLLIFLFSQFNTCLASYHAKPGHWLDSKLHLRGVTSMMNQAQLWICLRLWPLHLSPFIIQKEGFTQRHEYPESSLTHDPSQWIYICSAKTRIAPDSHRWMSRGSLVSIRILRLKKNICWYQQCHFFHVIFSKQWMNETSKININYNKCSFYLIDI